jgi:predicted aldo/keto reductase-like oxidoreductase
LKKKCGHPTHKLDSEEITNKILEEGKRDGYVINKELIEIRVRRLAMHSLIKESLSKLNLLN